MLKDMLNHRKLIWELSKNDFKSKFAGSYFGVFWAFIQPIINVTIYWIIFEGGLKAGPSGNIPFLLWLIAGICPWFYINDSLNSSSNCLVEYSYIVKKVKFNIKFIPIIKIMSATYIHLFFIAVTVIIFKIYGFDLTIYVIQTFYYFICLLLLILGVVYFISAINVFFRDMAQIVAILLQYSMWTVPIMIAEEKFPLFMQGILKYNPLYYIVQGYRDSFINHIWFWEKPGMTIYYWCLIAIILLIGIKVFEKLRLSFADVL